MKPLRLCIAIAVIVATASVVGPNPRTADAAGFAAPERWHEHFSIGDETPMVGDIDGDGIDDVWTHRAGPAGGKGGTLWAAEAGDGAFTRSSERRNSLPAARVPAVGDVDGDGDDDLVLFVQDAQSGDLANDVVVSLSDGSALGPTEVWHDYFSLRGEIPRVGDVNGDGHADIVTFVQGTKTGDGRDDVYVALSEDAGDGLRRFGPATRWHSSFSSQGEWPHVADVDGDGNADIVNVVGRKPRGDERTGDIEVALSDGVRGFSTTRLWLDGSLETARSDVGDIDGDGRDDVIAIAGDARGQRGLVRVSFSDGDRFSNPDVWREDLARRGQAVGFGDVDGTGTADAVEFNRSTVRGRAEGDVFVYRSGIPAPGRTIPGAYGHGSMLVSGKPALGVRPLLVILLDFTDARFAASGPGSPAYYRDYFFDGSRNVADFYAEQSQGLFAWGKAGPGVIGPFTHRDVRGTRGDESTWLCAFGCGSRTDVDVRREAIRLASINGFDFSAFDTNGNGKIGPTELTLYVLEASPQTGGAARGVDCFRPTGSSVEVCGGFVPGSAQGTPDAIIQHELGHTLGMYDVYGTRSHSQNRTLASSSVPGWYHLDPWHKIQLGWIRPRIFGAGPNGSCVTLDAGHWGGAIDNDERRPVLIPDPDDRRSFTLLEHRAGADAWTAAWPYDSGAGDGGLIVWQVSTSGGRSFTAGDVRYSSVEPRKVRGQINSGRDGRLQSIVRRDDVRVDDDGDGRADRIASGADRILQSRLRGDDDPIWDRAMITYGRGGLAGGNGAWTQADGTFEVRSYPGRLPTGLRIRVGPVSQTHGLPVQWTFGSFRGEAQPATTDDAETRACLEETTPPPSPTPVG